jgi:spermidine/putrescine transport system permease protein
VAGSGSANLTRDSWLSRLARGGNWIIPAFLAAWMFLVVVPILVLVVFSFFESRNFTVIFEPSLATWSGLFDSGRFEVTLRTLRIALTVTLIELLAGFPFALWLAKGGASKATRATVLALLTIPFFLDLSSRTIVWRAILGQTGLINSFFLSIGAIDRPMEWMLYTEWSVHFGMVLTYFPMMVLPIFTAMIAIDDTYIEASNDLGASPTQTLFNVIVPLSLPGVFAGVVLTLGSALAAWVEPSMLGGGFVNLLSNSVESAFTALRYPVVAALTTFVIALLAGLLLILMLVGRRFGDVSSAFKVLRS